MKLGIEGSVYEGFTFEEMIDNVAENGYVCVEVACWPQSEGEYISDGVCHIDVNNTSEEYLNYIKDYCAKKNVEISALSFYPNTMDGNIQKRVANVEHLKKVIHMSALLGVNMVTTFIGRDQTKSVEENLKLVKEVWPEIIALAEEKGVRIAIENCPMLFVAGQWPGGQNLFSTPSLWREIFKILPSKNLGINYDPSHFVWQQIDYIKPLYEFRDRIYHVHMKDTKLYRDKLDDVGVMAYPLEYMTHKLPGLGEVDWGKYLSALTDIGYDGYACVEVEDWSFLGSREKTLDAIKLCYRYMRQFPVF